MDLAFLLGPEGTRGKPSKPAIKEGQAIFAYNNLTAARPNWPAGKDIRIYVDTKAGGTAVARLPVNSYYSDYSGQTARITADNKNSTFGYILAASGDNTTPFYDSGIQVNTEAGVLLARKFYANEQFKISDKFYADSSGNGYFQNTLGIGGTNTGYKLYVNGQSCLTGLTMTGNITHKTTNFSSVPLKVLDDGTDYGHTLLIGAGGATFIASGEAAESCYNVIKPGSAENLYLTSDNLMYFITNCQNMEQKKTAILDTDLSFYPQTHSTGKIGISSNRWNQGWFRTLYTDDWFRSNGNSGWYSQSYGGGIYMTDSTWVRIFGGKSFYSVNGTIRTDNKLEVGPSGDKFYANSSGNGYFQNTLGIGGINTGYKLYVNGSAFINGRMLINSSSQSYLDGQRYQVAALNISDSTNTNGYWPWIRQKLNSGYMVSMGTLGSRVYIIGSISSSNTSDYDHGVYLDVGTGKFQLWKTNLSVNGTGNFTGLITGNLSGNATSATQLQTARTINGTSFNGTTNIITAQWGTPRNFTIGKTTKSVNGSTNIGWSTEEITQMSDIVTIERSMALTTSWQDVFNAQGVSQMLTKNGTYIVQIYINDASNVNGLTHYNEYYSGIMSWFISSTNGSDADEILLHKAGHSSNAHNIFLRTVRKPSSGYLTLQISADIADTTTESKSNLVFKFRRII